MTDLNEIKDINADLPLTKFPDEIDNLESFSDADDEINSAIIKYNNLLKQGETAKAEELYKQYSLKKYIISAHILNKIQQMIIACERSISSVKKYFSFSVEQPTSTTSQPNGYIWGKILSVGDYFKKVVFKLKDNGKYVDIYPQTTSDNVLITEGETETIKDKLETLDDDVEDLSDNKMDKNNPMGTGSFGMNLGDAIIGGEGFNSVSLGTSNTSVGKNSIALGYKCQALANNSIAAGNNLTANKADQLVTGRYNTANDTNYAHIIGGGTADNRKNIYTVDWEGNVKGNSFNAAGDIIYNGRRSLNTLDENHNALKEFSEAVNRTVVNHTTTIDEHTTSLNALKTTVEQVSSNYIITGISTNTVESATLINSGAFDSLDVSLSCRSNEKVICIPYAMSKYTCVGDIGYTYTSAGCIISINTINIDSSPHTTLVRYCLIRYKQIT